ncbi:MAG: multiphosphoryl transfer protein, partial [Actinoplanes sp.]|nr:multiphosphoryl transfer protein [Actinoplanes sp.]
MVGLVVVCHSRALARAAAALAAEMVPGKPVPIEVAAGLDETTFGTDAVAIMTAITAADQGDGVVLLMDLGSAVLSADLALEMLDDDQRDRVLLCPAPLVEGLVAATVAAAGGAGRQEIADEATAALAGKQSHLGAPTVPSEKPGERTRTGPSAAFTVRNPHGLHARPAARLVTVVRAFDADVEIRNRSTGSAWVPAASLSRVATLGALSGHELEVRAGGRQARAAVDQVVALAGRAFDEAAGVPEKVVTGRPGAGGLAASPGIGIGPVRHLRSVRPELPEVASRGAPAEWQRVEAALAVVRRDLRRLRTGGGAETAIFDAHLLLLDDADLLADVRSRIEQGAAAPQAWSAAGERLAAEFDALADPYLRGRAADVRAVTDQVLRSILGRPATALLGSGVLVAPDLTPAEAVGLDPEQVVGVLLAYGSPTSHGAILARSRGVPAVVGLGPAVLDLPSGTTVALDGGTGEVVVDPAAAVLADFRERATELRARRTRAAARSAAPALTRDGVPVAVGANVGSLADARSAESNGADLAGLVRTEFLFLGRESAPDVDEQQAAYLAIAGALDGRRITLRTLDVGGDKPLPYVPMGAEANPFLGVRGIRHSFEHPELLAQQLLAIIRVAHDVPVSVMFPMVSMVSEV